MSKNEIARYSIEKELGSGCFGIVYLAIDNENNKQVAIKRLSKVGTIASREIEILKKLAKAKQCINMIDCFYTTSSKTKMVQNMVFDFYPNNLESLILSHREKKKKMDSEKVRSYAHQLLLGLNEMHKQNILHRDLKPENLLLKDDHLVISDFGSSKFKKHKMKSTPYIVSRFYRAPELLLCLTCYDEKIDIWAAGCIFAEMCYTEPVFQGKDDGDQLKAIMRIMGTIPKETLAQFVSRGIPFSKKTLFKIQQVRMNDGELRKWMSMFPDRDMAIDLLKRMLAYDPEERISAEEALAHPFFKFYNGK